jgi:hypothetical protein
MAWGDIISQLIMGQQDPRQQLAAAVAAQGQPAAQPGTAAAPPTGADGTPGTGVADGGQQPPAARPVAGASPPDLSQMYMKLMQQDQLNKSIDSGLTTIAAGFARPTSRAALLQQAGSSGGSAYSPKDVIETLSTLQKSQADAAMKASLRARLPAIAKQYGLPMDTVNMLFETGKLQETLNTLAIPSTEVVERSDRSKALIDKRTAKQIGEDISGPADEDSVVVERADKSKFLMGKQSGRLIKELTPAEAKKYEVVKGERGGIDFVDPTDPKAGAISIKPPEAKTTNDLVELKQINDEREAAGQPRLKTEDWLKSISESKAPKTNIDTQGNALAKGFADTYVKDFESAQSSAGVINTIGTARKSLERGIVAGNVFAPQAVETRKVVASVLGIPDARANNSDEFQSAMKEIVLPRVKALGTGNSISDADVRFINAAVGSNVMTEDTLRRILHIMEKGERNKIINYNDSIDDLVKRNPEAEKLVRKIGVPDRNVPIPQAAIDRLKANPTPDEIREFNRTFGNKSHLEVLGN